MSTLSVPAPTAHSHAKVAEKRQLNTAARRRLALRASWPLRLAYSCSSSQGTGCPWRLASL